MMPDSAVGLQKRAEIHYRKSYLNSLSSLL